MPGRKSYSSICRHIFKLAKSSPLWYNHINEVWYWCTMGCFALRPLSGKDGMHMGKISLPLGYDRFSEIRSGGYYYIDKTGLISELLHQNFKVSLITRPRRFGKSLALDTLSNFFDIRKDTQKLFEGLQIAEDEALCKEWQNQWPVVFITLKEVEDRDFEGAREKLQMLLSDLYAEHSYLLESDLVDAADKALFTQIRFRRGNEAESSSALYTLMRMMHAHFGKQVIVLIDEYDVPVAKANENGYYDEMLNLIRGVLGKTLKTNPFLKFAVITGCLKIAKESIFTGINNLVTDTISGERFKEFFGFTEPEVQRLLQDTGFEDHLEEMRRWYDGYRFGSADIYCPWDVLNHVSALMSNPAIKPMSYWENTSHNGILRNFIEMANSGERQDLMVNDKFEVLLAGGCIEEHIEENLTYDTVHSSESNLWSLLYLTGYLTQAAPEEWPGGEPASDGKMFLRIPNEEIRDIFRKTVVEWFRARVVTMDRRELFDAMWSGDAGKAADIISELLFDTISYHDYKEDFYHAFIAGVFAGAGYYVESNREHGTGRTDLVIRDKGHRRVMIIEAKHVKKADRMEAACREAVDQIDDRRYAVEFDKGYRSIICYGIAFYKKECLVEKFDEVKRSK